MRIWTISVSSLPHYYSLGHRSFSSNELLSQRQTTGKIELGEWMGETRWIKAELLACPMPPIQATGAVEMHILIPFHPWCSVSSVLRDPLLWVPCFRSWLGPVLMLNPWLLTSADYCQLQALLLIKIHEAKATSHCHSHSSQIKNPERLTDSHALSVCRTLKWPEGASCPHWGSLARG